MPRLEECLATWQELILAPTVGDVEKFGRRLLDLAEKHGNQPLHDYAASLTGSASRFDIVAMENTLQEFEPLFVAFGREAENPRDCIRNTSSTLRARPGDASSCIKPTFDSDCG